jgi:hypothetical protein
MREFKHISLGYTLSRLMVLFDFIKHPEKPWLTSEAVFIIDNLIRKNDFGVEFGSGRSTPWLASRMKKLCSIEDDCLWYKRVKSMLEKSGYASRVDYRLCEDSSVYVAQSNTFSDESIDFCLIDGTARDQCAVSIIPKIKVGGILVIDNCNWYLPNDKSSSPNSRRAADGPKTFLWQNFLESTSMWRKIYTTNGVTDTAIYIKIN